MNINTTIIGLILLISITNLIASCSRVQPHSLSHKTKNNITYISGQKAYDYERTYQEYYCEGTSDVTLTDKTRADCLTNTHAIEFDFGEKWYEAVGQSLHYSALTGKRAGIFLIIHGKKGHQRHANRMINVIHHFNLPIDAWIFTVNEVRDSNINALDKNKLPIKRSNSFKCHSVNSRYYEQTGDNYLFPSMEDCLKSHPEAVMYE